MASRHARDHHRRARLRGRLGWLTRAHGAACDSLVAVDLVTATGECVRASADENAELLWGLRGGGGNAGREVLAPIGELGELLADALGPMPYTRIQSFFDAAWLPGLQNYWKAEYIDDADDAALATFARFAAANPSPLSDAKIMQLGGAFERVPDGATAFAHRSAPTVLNINARWTDPADSARHITWAREPWEAM